MRSFRRWGVRASCGLIRFRDKGYSQDQIFYEMTKWLYDATNEKWRDCEIVIAYFTQKCEVFDVIAE